MALIQLIHCKSVKSGTNLIVTSSGGIGGEIKYHTGRKFDSTKNFFTATVASAIEIN